VGVGCDMRGMKDCERDKNMKMDGEEERKKNERSGKKMSWKKLKNFFHFGARENRPTTTTKMTLRACQWTIGTSVKVLHDTSSNTFASI
jgi:hypothetical protein